MSAGRGSPAHLILYRKHVIKGGWRPTSSLHPLRDRVRTTVMLNVIFMLFSQSKTVDSWTAAILVLAIDWEHGLSNAT